MPYLTPKIPCFTLRLWLRSAIVAAFFVPAAAAAQSSIGSKEAGLLGDRLLVEVNHIPYTQRQLELYFVVRENLRATPLAAKDALGPANWQDALRIFTEDMVILQEAQRLGSFAAADQALDKYTALLRSRRVGGTVLARTIERLGCDDVTLSHTLDSVLRVIAFRRSKDRQEAQEASAQAAKRPSTQAKWLTELQERASTRLFRGASTYLQITPIFRTRDDGL